MTKDDSESIKLDDFISKKLWDIYNDFNNTIISEQKLCRLKHVHYAGENKPDYSISLVQQYYLLRYLYAYLYEYHYMYSCLFRTGFLKPPLKILSIGCGCGVDYWGLYFTANETDRITGQNFSGMIEDINYCGVDAVKWGYRDNFFKNNVCFREVCLDGNFNLGINPKYNIIFFPKSIAEFDDKTFQALLNNFESTEYASDKICLMCSIRKEPYCAAIDSGRVDQLSQDLLQKGYRQKNQNCEIHFNGSSIKSNRGSYDYPQKILSLFNSLHEQCSEYQKNQFQPCDKNCKDMNRHPILKTDHAKSMILKFERA